MAPERAPAPIELLVLGGGLAGLGAGTEARRRGLDSLIVERERDVGGLCRSVSVGGCDFDYGPKVLVPERDDDELLTYLAGDYDRHELVEEAYLDGIGFVGFPVQDHLDDLPPDERTRIEADLEAERRTPREVRTYRDWLLASYGARLCETVLFPYEEKKWGVELGSMDHGWAAGRRVPPPLADRSGRPRGRRYFYPAHDSFARVPEAVAAVAGPVRLGTEVTQVRPSDRVVVTDRGEIPYRNLVSSLPLDELVARIPPEEDPPRELAAALGWLQVRVFNLVFDERWPVEGSVMHFCGPGLPFRRATVVSALCPPLARPGRVPISVEVSVPPDVPDERSEPEQLSDVLGALRSVPRFRGLGDPLAHQVLTIDHAYPRADRGALGAVRELRDWCRSRGIGTCGRGGEFAYINSDVAFRHGREAVRAVARTR